VRFVDQHRESYGVEPICEVLQIAPSTYYAAKSRPPSARALRDEMLRNEIVRIQRATGGGWSTRQVWRQLQDDGVQVARCTVERLMRDLHALREPDAAAAGVTPFTR
jgi:putative transposase